MPEPTYKYKKFRELSKAIRIGTSIKSTTNSRKVKYNTDYELNKQLSEKNIVNEINRLSMTSDYGV